MRKSADAVTLMQPNFNYTLLFPKQIEWDSFFSAKPDVPFSDEVLDFLSALSGSLLKDSQSRLYPDVCTFAFFCRKGNLLNLKKEYLRDGEIRLGRGVLFHIAPGNVPVNFAYSLVSGLLAGNLNVVRISGKDFPQVELIIRHLEVLARARKYSGILGRIALVRYERDSEATAYFSSKSNVRVIWGGDKTIETIRKSPIPSRSFDICFADRYSIAAIDAKTVNVASDEELEKLAEDFYNDTYLFDQNACSAPHTVFWLDSGNVSEAKNRFWAAVHKVVSEKYKFQPVMATDKLTAFYRQAVNLDVKKEKMPDNYIFRASLGSLPMDIEDYRCACGYFSEYTISSLNEIALLINAKYQTLAYYGISKESLEKFVLDNRIKGLDRIVPVGHTTDFSLTWDGWNLIDNFTRVILLLKNTNS